MLPDNDAPLILAGDTGGTKTNLAIFEVTGTSEAPRLERRVQNRFKSGDYPDLNAIIREFLEANPVRIASACFGVPGPVSNRKANVTNLPWGVDADEISGAFNIPKVELLNDLAANAYGIAALGPEDIETLQAGDPQAIGNRCVVSPGTGLGEAGLFWDGKRHRVWACEGGHAEFAPRNEIEIELLRFLINEFGHVSAERVVSGQGALNIYRFLRDTGRYAESPEVAEEMKHAAPGYVIQKHADAGTCPMCKKALEIFVNCLGGEAGNMALKAMSLGGVYLGGGVSAKMLSTLKKPEFLQAFLDKGRFRGLLEKMPVRVIMNDEAALLGSARCALDLLG